MDVYPHEDEQYAGCDTAYQYVESLRPVFRFGALYDVAHDRVGDSIPDLTDHRDSTGQSGVHPYSVCQEYDKERVDDNKASSAEDLTYAVSEPAEKSVIRFSACDFFLHNVLPFST